MDSERLSSAKLIAGSVFLLLVSWRVCGSLLRRYFVRKLTVLNELQDITKERPDSKRIKGTAVICGGSIAGLLTARICANHFEDVLIIEPEAWLATEEGRTPVYDEKGVIVESRRINARTRIEQYDAVHAFLPLALKTATTLFPDFEEDMKKADGRIIAGGVRFQHRDGYIFRSKEKTLFGSRELIERMLRGEVMKSNSRIRWMVGTATGIQFAPDNASYVSHVNVRPHSGPEMRVSAALVVDCSGGAQVGLKWLKRIQAELDGSGLLKYPRMPNAIPFNELKQEYSTTQRYRKFRFYVPPEARARLPIPDGYENAGWVYSYFPAEITIEKRNMVVNRVEGHRLEVLFLTRDGDQAPNEFDEFIPFIKSIGVVHSIPAWVYEMMEILLEYKDQAEDLGMNKLPAYTNIRYEKAQYLPSNFAVVGDAAMRVNPSYGQGIAKACIGAITLDATLRHSCCIESTSIVKEFSRKYAEMHAAKTKAAWDTNKPTDYVHPSTIPVKGETFEDLRTTEALLRLLLNVAIKDDDVDATIMNVRGFVAPPTDLFRPSIIAKTLLVWLKIW